MCFRRIFIHLFELVASTTPSSLVSLARSPCALLPAQSDQWQTSAKISNRKILLTFLIKFKICSTLNCSSVSFILLFFASNKTLHAKRPTRATFHTTVRAFHGFSFAIAVGENVARSPIVSLSLLYVVYLFKFGVRFFFFFFVPSFGVRLHPQLPTNEMQ